MEISAADFGRVEEKVDKLTEAVSKLVLFEERQAMQGQRIGKVEERLAAAEAAASAIDRKVDSWINRGIGGWAIVITVWSLYQAFKPVISN